MNWISLERGFSFVECSTNKKWEHKIPGDISPFDKEKLIFEDWDWLCCMKIFSFSCLILMAFGDAPYNICVWGLCHCICASLSGCHNANFRVKLCWPVVMFVLDHHFFSNDGLMLLKRKLADMHALSIPFVYIYI